MKMNRTVANGWRGVGIGLFLVVSAVGSTQHSGDNPYRIYQLRTLPKTTLVANGHKIVAWVMDNDPKREEGLMFVKDKDIKPSQGMIFVFPRASDQSFWMHNTLIPLDIVYIAPNGKVLNIQKGKPQNDSPLPSAGAALYVLELKSGAAAKFGIKAGTKISIPANVKTSE